MKKPDFVQTFSNVIYGVFGMVCGIVLYAIHTVYRDYGSLLLAGIAVVGALLYVYFERQQMKRSFQQKLTRVTQAITNSTDTGEDILFDEAKGVEMASLYLAAQQLQQKFKKENNIHLAALTIINALALNIELNSLIDAVLPKILSVTKSNWGVFYIYNKATEKMELKHSIGLSRNVYREFDVSIGEGMIGIAAQTREISIFKDIPDDTVYENKTFLGKINPKSIMTIPILSQDAVVAVIAVASMYNYTKEQRVAMNMVRNYLGLAVSNCLTYERTQRLSKELQFQNELIQNMNDELEKKVSERTRFLNRIINNINDYMIVILNKEGNITTWNAGAEAIRGYSASEVIGKNITDLCASAEEKQQVSENLKVAREKGQFSEQNWRARRNQDKYFADVLITSLWEDSEEFQGYAIITKDISDTLQMQQALLKEEAFNNKLLDTSREAIIITDPEGSILHSNQLAVQWLAYPGTVLQGRGISEFFTDSFHLKQALTSVTSTSGNGEITKELLYKHDHIESITLRAMAITIEEKSIGILIYIHNAKEDF